MVFVWYGVMWSILGDDAFPKEITDNGSVKASDSTEDVRCMNNSFTVLSSSSFVVTFESASVLNESLSFIKDTLGLLDIPDGHFFALFVLLVFSALCGYCFTLFYLHHLTGMLIAGFILRNVPYIGIADDIHSMWSSTIRNISLVVVLVRGGLSLNVKKLKRLKLAVFLLAVLPCVCEGAIDGVVATFLLPIPWKWGMMLGYVMHS